MRIHLTIRYANIINRKNELVIDEKLKIWLSTKDMCVDSRILGAGSENSMIFGDFSLPPSCTSYRFEDIAISYRHFLSISLVNPVAFIAVDDICKHSDFIIAPTSDTKMAISGLRTSTLYWLGANLTPQFKGVIFSLKNISGRQDELPNFLVLIGSHTWKFFENKLQDSWWIRVRISFSLK